MCSLIGKTTLTGMPLVRIQSHTTLSELLLVCIYDGVSNNNAKGLVCRKRDLINFVRTLGKWGFAEYIYPSSFLYTD